MNERDIKRKAKAFRRAYLKNREVSAASLADVFEEQGFTVVPFTPSLPDPDVDTVVEGLGLQEQVKHSNGFLYVSPYYRIVFLQEKLSQEEKCLVLAHEEGHYFLGHNGSEVGRGVLEEYEAHLFAWALLRKTPLEKAGVFLRRHKAKLAAGVLALALILGGGFALKERRERLLYEGEYYVTEHGKCYHLKNCMTITGRKVERLTKERYQSGAYTPCSVCLPGGK